MGVRFDIYAIDEARFAEFLQNSIGSVLRTYYEQGNDSNGAMYFWDTSGSVEYAALSQKKFWIRSLVAPFVMKDATWDDLHNKPFLEQRLHDYIKGDSDIWFNTFLRQICGCPNYSMIRKISSGYRRWWVGSVFQESRRATEIDQVECDQVGLLFQRMLRSYNCGYALPATTWEPDESCFPVMPQTCSEMSVWSAEEARLVTRFIQKLLLTKPSFKRPPGKVGVAVETDEEWNEWVHAMLHQLLALENLGYAQPKVVSFIG
jgi:hypothetical protein